MSYLDYDWITETIQKDAEDALNLFMSKITDYMLAYQTKILNIQAPVQAPGANADPSVGNSLSTSSSSNGGNNQAAKTAKVNVDIEAEKISMEVKSLHIELRKNPDWETADNYAVELAMSRVESWQRRLKLLKESVLSMKKNILSFDLDDAKLLTSEAAVKSLEAELDICIENVEYEDDSRNLQSLAKSKPTEVKFPQFGGGK